MSVLRSFYRNPISQLFLSKEKRADLAKHGRAACMKRNRQVRNANALIYGMQGQVFDTSSPKKAWQSYTPKGPFTYRPILEGGFVQFASGTKYKVGIAGNLVRA